MNAVQRISLGLLRYLPVASAALMLAYVLALLLFDKRINAIEAACGCSVVNLLTLIAVSRAFGFCPLHRLFIYYCCVVNMCIFAQQGGLFSPVLVQVRIALAAIGVALFVVLIIKRKQYRCCT